MSKLTLTIDEEILKRARIRALSERTSVNAVLRDFLEAYAGLHNDQTTAVRELIAASKNTESRRGNRQWSRDDLHKHGPCDPAHHTAEPPPRCGNLNSSGYPTAIK